MRLSRGRVRNLDSIFEALADETRRSMLDRLRDGPLTIGVLAQPYSMSLNGASKHVKKLEKAGLIRRHVRGREHFCVLNAGGLEEAMGWMSYYSEFWDKQISALETYVVGKRKQEEK